MTDPTDNRPMRNVPPLPHQMDAVHSVEPDSTIINGNGVSALTDTQNQEIQCGGGGMTSPHGHEEYQARQDADRVRHLNAGENANTEISTQRADGKSHKNRRKQKGKAKVVNGSEEVRYQELTTVPEEGKDNALRHVRRAPNNFMERDSTIEVNVPSYATHQHSISRHAGSDYSARPPIIVNLNINIPSDQLVGGVFSHPLHPTEGIALAGTNADQCRHLTAGIRGATSHQCSLNIATTPNHETGVPRHHYLTQTGIPYLSEAGAYLETEMDSTRRLNTQGCFNRIERDGKAMIKEQLLSHYEFFGERELDKIIDSFVVVLGLGAVGSHVAMSLARSGVSKFRLIDSAKIRLASLNRHAAATCRDIDRPKVEVMRSCIEEVNRHCTVEAINCIFSERDVADYISRGHPSFVVDCINTPAIKASVASYCKKLEIPYVSASSVTGRDDPTRLRLADISEITNNSLAVNFREALNRKGISSGVTVCFTAQLNAVPPSRPTHPQDSELFLNRKLPVFAPLPAIMGQMLAAHVIRTLGEKPIDPGLSSAISMAMDKLTSKNYKRLYQTLKEYVSLRHNTAEPKDVTTDTIGPLDLPYEETYKIYIDCFAGRNCLVDEHNNGIVPTVPEPDTNPATNCDTKSSALTPSAQISTATEGASSSSNVNATGPDNPEFQNSVTRAAPSLPKSQKKDRGLALIPWVFTSDTAKDLKMAIGINNMVLVSPSQARTHLAYGGTVDANRELWGREVVEGIGKLLRQQSDPQPNSDFA